MPAKKTIAAFSFLLFSVLVFAQELRVEPMNWWVGMKNQELQLLVHADEIGETVPSINYAGVVIKRIHQADSKNYLFIDLFVSKTTKPGTFPILFKKAGKTSFTCNYTLLPRKKDASHVKGFTSSDVIYLIT
ncbi:MAG: cyclomaltodextrinase N-terminal domain-containing protein [Bacteroidota bacterium]